MVTNGDDRGGDLTYGLPGAPEIFLFRSLFFLTYFLILTGANAVPNGRERPNGDEGRRTGWGTDVRAARCARIPVFRFLFFYDLLFYSHRRRRRPKRPRTAQRR
jgi:hypothetical protein